MRRIIVRLLPACLSLLVAGCVTVPPPTPTQPVVTPPAAGEVLPAATHTVTPVRVHPLATRTGVEEIDRVIDVVLMADRDVLRSMIRPETTPCTTREGLGGPPKCAPGEREGTPVEVFPIGGPEGSFVRAAEIDRILPGAVSGLYAVYKVHEGPNAEPYWPAGDYALVFVNGQNELLIVRTTRQGIVRLDHALGSPADLSMWVGEDAVLPPPGE